MLFRGSVLPASAAPVVLRLTRHIGLTDHFGKECFQTVDCTVSDN